MSGVGCLGTIMQERTVRLLVLPIGTVVVTLAMTALSGVRDRDGAAPLLFISSGMNNADFEPWSLWLPRYYLWHLLIFSVVSFKLRALPRGAAWVAELMGLLVAASIWTMNTQWPIPRKLLFAAHVLVAGMMVLVGFFETVVVWRPHPAVAGSFASLGVAFVGLYVYNRQTEWSLPDSGIPGIGNRWEIPVQWTLFATFLFISWFRYPRIEAEMLRGGWQPYLPAPLANLFFGQPPQQPAKYDTAGSNSCLWVFFEERTFRMIILPVGTLLVTAAMTVLAFRDFGGEDQLLFLSSALSNEEAEPWSVWLPRCYLWHLLIFSVASFKRRALPARSAWISDLAACALFLFLWSGYLQTQAPIPEAPMSRISVALGGIISALLVVEAVVVWWPNRTFAMVYALVLAEFFVVFALQQFPERVTIPDTGIPFIGNRIEIVLQWTIVITHLVVVWYRFPKVEVQTAFGEWELYLPESIRRLIFNHDSSPYSDMELLFVE